MGVGEGPWLMGEGRSRASHNNKSQSLPTPTLSHRFPATLDTLTQAEGPCGPKRLRRRRVARLSLAQSRRPRSSASLLGPQHQQQPPTSGSPATQANGFRKSRPILPDRSLASHCLLSLSAGARCWRPGGLPRPTRFPALFSILPFLCL